MSDLDSRKLQTSDDQAEAQPAQRRVFEEFCSDLENLESLGATPQELEALSRASLLGILNSKEDVAFILRQIRESMKRTASPESPPPPGSIQISVNQVDAPTRDFGKLTETIRSAALVKLDELDLKALRRSKSVIGRLESAWGRFTMTLSRVQSIVAQVARRSVTSRPV
jgi:hypothetical protein